MAIVYNIYANDGTGGPVDYSTPIATTSELTYVPTILLPGTDTTFAVRAQAVETDLEDKNTDAFVRIVIDASGTEIGNLPGSPFGLGINPVAGGGCVVSWAYDSIEVPALAANFNVYIEQGTSLLYNDPIVSIPFVPGQIGYVTSLPGPYTYSTYTVGVVAINTSGLSGNPISATVNIGFSPTSFEMESIGAALI